VTGYIRHSGAPKFTCFAHEEADVEAFKSLVLRHAGGGREVRALGPLGMARLSETGTLYTPGPDLSRYAWLRRGIDQRAFSLVGVTHTLSDSSAMDAIGSLLTAPIQSWDALVCTTALAKRVVERVLEEYGDYFATLSGQALTSRAQLPVIPLGVDCDAFEPRPGEGAAFRARFGIAQDDILLLYLGRLDHAEKANPIPLYLAAENAAARTGKRIHLLEVGWFRSDAFAEGFAQAAAVLAPSVNRILLDSREDANRRAWVAADIFVSLADSVQETFGLTPVEAMAAGVPVVVSDWNGYRETVRDGIDGIRVPTVAPGIGSGEALAFDYASGNANHALFSAAASQSTAIDVVACAEALIRLIESPALRREMGEAGRRHARTQFDWRVVIAAYQELWSALAERRRAGVEAAPVAAGRAARPLGIDPFDLFRDWPTASLSPETILTLPGGSDAAVAAAMRRLWVAAPVPAMLLDEAATGAVLSQLGNGPMKAGDLVDMLAPAQRAAAWRTLGWLAKTGLIRWR